MACQIKRSAAGEISKVLAPNGNESIAYDSLLKVIEALPDTGDLKERFKSWEGKHINNVEDNKELALGLYKQLYSPAFKEWFGDWTEREGSKVVDKNGEPLVVYHGTIRKGSIDTPYEGRLFFSDRPEIANRAIQGKINARMEVSDEDPEKLELNSQVYPVFLNIRSPKYAESQSKTVSYTKDSATQEGKDGVIKKNVDDEIGTWGRFNEYITFSPNQVKSLFNTGEFSKQQRNIYQQIQESATPSKATPATLKKIREFLDRVGVDVETVYKIPMDGGKLGANGVADGLRGLIQVAQGKEDVALTEEAMHIAVELLEKKNPALFRKMLNAISQYNVTDQVFNDYGRIKEYQRDGKPDVLKLKKEAMGKVLAQTIINKAEDSNENAALLAQAKTWWQQIIEFLKGLFLKAQMNPFEQAAEQILSGEDIGSAKGGIEGSSTFAQISQNVVDKIAEVDRNLAKVEGGFELNGEKVRHTVDEKVEETIRQKRFERPVTEIQKQNREYKESVEKDTKADLYDIFQRRIDDDGFMRDTPLEQTLPSVVDPYSNATYNVLDAHIKERLESYPTGTRFLKNVNILDDKTSTAGNIDLLAALPDGKMDILQFKVPDTGTRTDIPTYLLAAYDVEIENLRKILQNGYGISRKDFRQTRAIPIRANYTYNIPGDAKSGLRLQSVNIGGTNVKAIQDDVLIPVASRSETTGNEHFDRFILRMQGLADKMAKEKVPPEKRLEKSTRVARLIASIRKLKVQGKAEGVLSSANTIVRRQQENLIKLKERIDITDPKAATDKDLNNIANEIDDERDQVQLYADLYQIFKEVFSDGTEESKEYISKARDISDEADTIVRQYWNMAVNFRKEKIAAKQNINDEFIPEKQLTWYRRMVRSLSQSSIKAGALLWGLVKNINSRLETEFHDRYENIKKLEKGVDQWLKGKNIKELYHKIFQFKDGKWNGKIIQKFSKDFYTELRDAQEKQDLRWVKANIDIEAYKAWYKEERERMVENAKTARVHEDDERNKQLIRQSLQDFINTFSLDKARGVNPNNYRLKDFPLDKWHSSEYTELLKPENEPVLELYNHWIDMLEESLGSGMINEHNGWSWFPNVRRNLIEKLTTAPGSGKVKSLFGSMRIENEDYSFGKIDPVTGKAIDEIHALYVSDLGEWVKGADGNYFLDYSEKSMDIFKVMALWEKEMIKFKLRTESEGLARLIAYTEEGREAYKTKKTGKLDRDENGFPILISNEVNAKYVKEHIEAVWYGKHMSDESDVSITLPYKGFAERINKLFGKEIIPIPEEDNINISGVKALHAVNRFFVNKTLGLNVFTSLAQVFGGTANTYMNQGKFFDKKDILESELEYTSGTFWNGEERKKMAGLLSYFHIHLEDKSEAQIRNLSVSNAVKFFSSDHLFIGQRIADAAVNNVITMAYIKNTMVKDGKLVNIREEARKELGHTDKYAQGSVSAKEFEKRLDQRVEQLRKSPDALLNTARIEDDHIVIPGVSRDSDTMVEFREGVKQFIRNALGNTTKEDLALYKRSIMWQSFFMFKNWIPRMLDVRGQTLKYNPGSQSYEWGRMRMLTNAVIGLVKNTNTSLLKSLSGNKEDLITVAKEEFKRKQREFAEQEEEFTMNEAEFVDMYIKGVRAQFKELVLALGMFSMLVAARAAAPDKDEEAHVRGAYKWMLRGIDKLQDEVSFFYNPISFTNIVNGSVFPAVGLLVDVQKFMYTGLKKIYYHMVGDEQKANKEKAAKYLFKIMPITKELLTYIAIFNDDIAKEYGIKLSSQYGSLR